MNTIFYLSSLTAFAGAVVMCLTYGRWYFVGALVEALGLTGIGLTTASDWLAVAAYIFAGSIIVAAVIDRRDDRKNQRDQTEEESRDGSEEFHA